ncbi:MAG: class I SAM-dependent methyltransferase [Phycisphaeraceae bacterium]|nr:class I SAM-dependent methyltransferase [Phycisphaeraceae bacterium]
MTMSLATPRFRLNPYFLLCLASLALAIFAIRTYGQPEPAKPTPTGVAKIQHDAQALLPTLKSDLARSYVSAATHLPHISPRTLYRHKTTRAWLSKSDFDHLAETDKPNYAERSLDESFYYNTGYGSPLAYSRAFEVLAQHGVTTLQNLRTLDYGCGGIAPMRLQAHCGADAVGVDIETLFPLYYNQPDDQGELKTGDLTGKVTLITGRWPAEEPTAKAVAVGGGYDLILSKNTLKKGYVTPEKPADERFLVKLGVADVNFCKALFDSLKPGGKVLIYNICGKQPADKYLPMADGRCPFPKEMLETVGFEVLALDADDSEPCRAMAHILGWDQGSNPMNLSDDLFATYTLLQRPK